MQNALI
jgi:1,4-dihydroxy-2-naphthoate octaprenyltransferase